MTGAGSPIEPDPVIEVYTQNLRRSIDERIDALMQLQYVAEEFRRAGRREAILEERRQTEDP
jgi:hypothetical protein